MNHRPDVFLISIDCLRPDYVGAFNRLSRLTPNLDRILEPGALFTNAVSHAPFTTPAVASLLTGQYPCQNGVRLLLGQVCRPMTTTIATIARAAGYRTAGFPSTFILNASTGLSRGFDEYRDIDDGHYSGRGGCWQTGDALNAALDGFLAKAGRDPVFAWLHYFDLHEYHTDAAAPPHVTYARDLREKVDRDCIGGLLAILDKHDRRRDAAFIITADHGECLFQHGVRGHGQHLYDSVIRVPLGIHWPGSEFARPRVERRQARHVDLLPTLADLWGFVGEPHAVGSGISLRRSGAPGDGISTASYAEASPKQLFEGNTAEIKSFQGPELQSLRTDQFKYIRHRGGRDELYDLMSDPTEYFDLLQSGERDGALIAALRAQLAEFESESDNLAARASLSATAQAVVRDRLSRLGYIGQDAVSSQTCASGANQTDD